MRIDKIPKTRYTCPCSAKSAPLRTLPLNELVDWGRLATRETKRTRDVGLDQEVSDSSLRQSAPYCGRSPAERPPGYADTVTRSRSTRSGMRLSGGKLTSLRSANTRSAVRCAKWRIFASLLGLKRRQSATFASPFWPKTALESLQWPKPPILKGLKPSPRVWSGGGRLEIDPDYLRLGPTLDFAALGRAVVALSGD